MDDDDDGVMLPPGVGGTDSSSEDDGICLPASSTDMPPRRGRAGRPREPPTRGSFRAWFVADVPMAGAPVAAAPRARLPGAAATAERRVVGLGRVEWLLEASDHPGEANVAGMPVAAEQDRAGVIGRLVYNVVECWRLRDPVQFPDDLDITDPLAQFVLRDICGSSAVEPGGTTVDVLLDRHAYIFDVVFILPSHVSVSDFDVLPREVMVADLRSRLKSGAVVDGHPPQSSIASWRKKYDLQTRHKPKRKEEAGDVYLETLLAMPEKKARTAALERGVGAAPGATLKREFDPVKKLDALSFCRFLKSPMFQRRWPHPRRTRRTYPPGLNLKRNATQPKTRVDRPCCGTTKYSM